MKSSFPKYRVTNFSCFIIGEDPITVQCGDMLLSRGHVIRGVVSEKSEVARWAKARGVRSIDAGGDLKAILEEHPFDYLFSIANMRLLSHELVSLPRAGAINFHDGPLPQYAGIHTTSWALINRERKYGITWHFINNVVDGGKILKQRMVQITEGETAHSLKSKCVEAGIEAFGELIEELAQGTHEALEQDFSKRKYFGMWERPKAAGIISWHQSAEEISAIGRALDLGTYPNAIGRAKMALGTGFVLCPELEVLGNGNGSPPGTITGIETERIRVASAHGELGIRRLMTLDGKPLSLTEVVSRYGLRPRMKLPEPDYAERERITGLNNEICKYESFWLNRLSSLHAVPLPYLETTDTLQQTDGATELNASISPELLRSVKRFLPTHKTSDFLAAAFALYLARMGGEGRFDLGLRWPGLSESCADLGGLFATEVPWRVDVDLAMPVRQEMVRVLEALETTREKKTYLNDVWTRWPELRNIAEKTGFPTLPARVELVKSMTGHSLQPGCHLALLVDDQDECRLVCQPFAFKVENAQSMVEHFRTFLKALCSEPERRVAELPVLTNSEQRQILHWNDTAAPFPHDKCTPHLFEEQVEKTPTLVALAFKESTLSYSELNARANQLARHLCKLGVGPDAIVGICVQRSVEMVVGLLGIQKAGGAYLPLDPTYPKERLAFIMQDAQVQVLITQEELAGSVPPHQAKIVRLDTDWSVIAREESTNFSSGVRPDHLAYVIYTSGSTGKPKGVMVEHRNVVSFFTGMDARLPHQPGDVWLAVTSLSFDISVLELFWTLCRGFKVVIYPDDQRKAVSASGRNPMPKRLDYGLFYFSADQGEHSSDKYRLLIEGAKFADENAFVAVWTPERHFHEFGGLYPNPSVTSAALAMITKRLQIRSGSVVAPLHSPIRIAEEWSVVDNLSGGRVAISFASGWMPEDFAVRPEDFATKKEVTFRHMDVVRRLWRGERVDFPGPLGKDVSVRTLPRPIQPELPVWVTTSGNPETYEMAAKAGANVLTHLLGQSIEDVGKKIALYRKAWQQAGHPGRGRVTLMLHTFVSDNGKAVKETVRAPLTEYLRTSADLLKNYSWAFSAFKNQKQGTHQVNFSDLPAEELNAVLEFAFERYFETSGLFGTPETCLERVEQLIAHDVDEVACLIDFGLPTDVVLANLKHLNTVATASQPSKRDQSEATRDYRIGALIRRHGVTHFQCTPSMARMLLVEDDTRSALCQLQILMIGGEAFPVALARELRGVVTGRIINMYGPTETTIWSGTHELEAETHSIPIGRPILNTQFYVVDASLQLQPVGMPGELLIGGAGVARGYLNRPELTAERFGTNPFLHEPSARVYRTGDLARYLPNGNMEFLGRIDQQVKIRGHRIELGEIETLLTEHPSVREAVVIAREDTPGDKRLVGYVTLRHGLEVGVSELRDFLRERLPEHMVPARVVAVASFPQTPNRKIDRKALPPPEKDLRDANPDFETPQGPVEKKLAEIWAELLGIQGIGRKDDFFALGGDSLTLINVTLKSEEVFGKAVSVEDFVQARTIERVAKLLEHPTSERTTSVLEQPAPVERESLTVRLMSEADLDDVIQIHLDYFPKWRISLLGRPFLRKMYCWFMENNGDLALVAVKQGHIAGFTVGSVGRYKKSLFFYAFPEVIRGIASSPGQLIYDGILRFRSLFPGFSGGNGRFSTQIDLGTSDVTVATNRIMALSKSSKAGGLDLILAFEEAAKRRGVKAYFHPQAVENEGGNKPD